MMKINQLFFCVSILFLMSCKKDVYQGEYNPEIVKEYNNTSLDSVQTMNLITNQKIQEFYDLGLLYLYNNKDKELDSVLTEQMNNYFVEKDTTQIQELIKEIKTSKSHFIKIQEVVSLSKDSTTNDSLGISQFKVKYYGKDKTYLSEKNKFVKYILKKNPDKFKQEFKFYFVKFAESDSILKGDIK